MSDKTVKMLSDDDIKKGDWYVVFSDGDTYSPIDDVSLMCITEEGMEEIGDGKIRDVPKKHLIANALIKTVFNDFLVKHTYSPIAYTDAEAEWEEDNSWTE